MTEAPEYPLLNHIVSRLKIWLSVTGVLSLLTGLALLFWPAPSAIAVTLLLAAYLGMAGIVHIVVALTGGLADQGITGQEKSGWVRVGHGAAGAIFILASILAFINPGGTAGSLTLLVMIFIGVSWIFEGIGALTTLSLAHFKGWTVFFAIISILGGVAVMFAPMLAASVMFIWVGVTLIMIGVLGIIRAITLKPKKIVDRFEGWVS